MACYLNVCLCVPVLVFRFVCRCVCFVRNVLCDVVCIVLVCVMFLCASCVLGIVLYLSVVCS